MLREEADLPEEGEIVIATVKDITPYGAYVILDEYDNLIGFLHISEISTGWVRNIERFVKRGQKVVLKVIRVNKARREVDLSLRQVTGQERKEKLLEVKRNEKAKGIFNAVVSKLGIAEEEAMKYFEALEERYGSLYDSYLALLKKGRQAFENLGLPDKLIDELEEDVREKITLPSVEIKGIMELTTPLPNGVEIIKKALTATKERRGSAVINVKYLGAPRYMITVKADNYKIAERALSSAVEKAKEVIIKGKGTFNFIRELKKTRLS
jgi:translation initiation factor 2 subunit 1